MSKCVWSTLAALAVILVGCADKGDGLTKDQLEAGTRQKEILTRTGGDWNKLTDADRQYLLSMTHGNERVARMKFDAMSGRPPQVGPGAGGPSGGPGGTPPK